MAEKQPTDYTFYKCYARITVIRVQAVNAPGKSFHTY
jgi:hypothetical protein